MRLASRPRGIPQVSQAERDRRWRERFAECLAILDSSPSREAVAAAAQACAMSRTSPQRELDLNRRL